MLVYSAGEMDNPLTTKQIERLMYVAGSNSFSASKIINREGNATWTQSPCKSIPNQSESSGIIDLDNVNGFGDSGNIGDLSLARSTAFTANEMTGRSTEATAASPSHQLQITGPNMRRSLSPTCIEKLTEKMHQQSSDVKELMRQSVASLYSFNSKRDMSAEEASFIRKEAPLPVHPSQMNMKDSMRLDTSELSIGSYFQNNCLEVNKLFPHKDSPKYDVSSMCSTDNSAKSSKQAVKDLNKMYGHDDTLDDVPTRQPRNTYDHPLQNPIFQCPTQPIHQSNNQMKRPLDPPILTLTNATINVEQNKGPRSKILMDPAKKLLIQNVNEESNRSEEQDSSFNMSKIFSLLRNESTINVSDMLKQIEDQKKVRKQIQPLHEIDMNTEHNRMTHNLPQPSSSKVTQLKESKNTETATSASSVNTVIDLGNMKLSDQERAFESRTSRATSKSPSFKSPSTTSTVKDKNNYVRPGSPILECRSARSASKSPSSQRNPADLSAVNKSLGGGQDVPPFKFGDGKSSNFYGYKELDKSVDWQEILESKQAAKYQSKAKEPKVHVNIITSPMQGFVGASTSGLISVQSLSNSWLITKLEFTDLPAQGRDLTIDLPKFPILLTTEKIEEIRLKIASNVDLNSELSFTLLLKDPSMECDVNVYGKLPVEIKMPVLQAISSSGINSLAYPIIGEWQTYAKRFLLISECPIDLQLELSIVGSNLFSIKSVQEIEKSGVLMQLLETQPGDMQSKSKVKGMSRTLCRLSNGKALRVCVVFNAPKLDLQAHQTQSFASVLQVNLIGVNAMLRKVDMTATVGVAQLALDVQTDRLKFREKATVPVRNTGSVCGEWSLRFAEAAVFRYFMLTPDRLQLPAGAGTELVIEYVGPDAGLVNGTLIFEGSTGDDKVSLKITGGTEKPKIFPIKTNCSSMSWVRPDRKEISLKNYTEGRVHIKCRISGEGFTIDSTSPGQNFLLTLNPCECRPLSIVFSPKSGEPCAATLHLIYDGDTEISRKVTLYGCAGGECVSWRGVVTCGDMAHIRALSRAPVLIPLVNKGKHPSFFAATVQFTIQHKSAAAGSRLVGARRVLSARAQHQVALHVAWPRVERKVAAAGAAGKNSLAIVTILTGAETTRLRILRILKSANLKESDVPLPRETLNQLVGPFEGELPELANQLNNFNEDKSALEELADGLTELKVCIDLTEGCADDNTIMITDDTVMHYNTLCD